MNRRTHSGALAKLASAKCTYGKPRGWRPLPDDVVAGAPLVQRPELLPEHGASRGPRTRDDEADEADDAADYGIRIIWGDRKRRPGAKLETMARRA